MASSVSIHRPASCASPTESWPAKTALKRWLIDRLMRIQSIHAKLQKKRADHGWRRSCSCRLMVLKMYLRHQDQSSPKIRGEETDWAMPAQLVTLIFAQHNIIARHVYIDAVPNSNVYSGTVH